MDYSKPTAQMLGRWQPFHDGHLALFKEISMCFPVTIAGIYTSS